MKLACGNRNLALHQLNLSQFCAQSLIPKKKAALSKSLKSVDVTCNAPNQIRTNDRLPHRNPVLRRRKDLKQLAMGRATELRTSMQRRRPQEACGH